MDNVFVERLWRTVKCEDIYLKDYHSVRDCIGGLKTYFAFYNHQRPHQVFGGLTPAEVYGLARPPAIARQHVEEGEAASVAAASRLALRAHSEAAATGGTIHLKSPDGAPS